MLSLTKDGKILDKSGKEVTELKEYQQDQLIRKYFPGLPTARDWSRHSTSYHGTHSLQFGDEWNQTWLEKKIQQNAGDPVDTETVDCQVYQKVYALGGVRLATLYCNKFNFFSAATDLNMSYAALMKWFQRFRTQALLDGLTPEDLGLESVSNCPTD